jgi:hypothetical protein
LAIAFVNAVSASDVTGSYFSSFAAPAASHTTGNCLAVFCTHTRNSVNYGVTDSAGNTFTKMTTYSRNNYAEWFYAKNITGGASNVVTINFTSSNSDFPSIIVFQFSGVDTTAPADADVGSGSFINSPVTTPSYTTAQADEVILVGVNTNIANGYTAGTGYTIPTNGTSPGTWSSAEYQIVSAIQTAQTAQFTWSGGFADCEVALLSLKAVASGGTTSHQYMTMGCGQ